MTLDIKALIWIKSFNAATGSSQRQIRPSGCFYGRGRFSVFDFLTVSRLNEPGVWLGG
jgi:hypothetical protein